MRWQSELIHQPNIVVTVNLILLFNPNHHHGPMKWNLHVFIRFINFRSEGETRIRVTFIRGPVNWGVLIYDWGETSLKHDVH
jgi:hypothetical protein